MGHSGHCYAGQHREQQEPQARRAKPRHASDGLNQGEMLQSTHPCVQGSSRGTAGFTPEAFSPDTGTCPYLLPTPTDEGIGLLTENCLHLTACEVQTEL